MKYILTGGSGFIGSHFLDILAKKVEYNFDIIPPLKQEHKYNHVNILNKSKLFKNKIIDKEEYTLIHLAAVHFDFQKNFYETNVEGTKNILKYLELNNIKNFIFFSSVAVYGNSIDGKKETSNKNPINDYGKSKLEAEKIIIEWHKRNLDCRIIIVRPAVVFGENNFGNVFNLIMQIKSKFYAVVGNGNNIKSIAYVKNLVDSILFLLNNKSDKFFTYNYCDYPQTNTFELSKSISHKLNSIRIFRIPFIFTKLLTIPVDFFEKLFSVDLKINSMRIKKFTDSTFFSSDLIREVGYKQLYTNDNALIRTINWIINEDIMILRKKWYENAKKL